MATTTVGKEPPKVQSAGLEIFDAAAYNAFVATVVLESVDLVALDADRRAAGEATRTNFNLDAGFQVDDRAIYYRFSARGQLTDDSDTDCGHVGASVIVTIKVPDAADVSFAEQFGSTSAVMIAHPYLREAIASTAQRLGFPGVLLPLIVQQPQSNRMAPQVSGGPPVEAASSLPNPDR